MKPLYLVVGKSGSGKDFIVDKICKDFNMKRVISRTTRKPRNNTNDLHVFVSWEQSDKEFDNAIAKTLYRKNRYYVLQEDLEDKDFYIIDPQGIYRGDFSEINHRIVYIDVGWFRRFKNMRKRGDSFKNIIIRLINDYKDFKGFRGEINLKHNDELYWLIKGERN